MSKPNEPNGKTKSPLEPSLDVIPTLSVAIERIIEEIRNEPEDQLKINSAYNRVYHRHNR